MSNEPTPTDESPVEDATTTGTSTAATDTGSEKPPAEASSTPMAAGWSSRWRAVDRRQLGLRGAAAVLLGASLAASVFLFFENQSSKDLLAAQQQAREAACHYGPVLADYDSKKLDAYFKAVLDGSTGDWKKQFEATGKLGKFVFCNRLGTPLDQVVYMLCAAAFVLHFMNLCMLLWWPHALRKVAPVQMRSRRAP